MPERMSDERAAELQGTLDLWTARHGDTWSDGTQHVLSVTHADLRSLLAARERVKALEGELEAARAEAARMKQACIKQNCEIEQSLGLVLYGYSDDGLPLWGDHVAETLAIEAAARFTELEADRKAQMVVIREQGEKLERYRTPAPQAPTGEE